jgi:hypothetical protein
MANVFNKTSMLWKVDTAETLVTKAPGMNTAYVSKVVMIPNAANDAITFQNSAGEDSIYLKAGATDTSPVHIDFSNENSGRGRRVYGLTCSALSTSVVAYVYLA